MEKDLDVVYNYFNFTLSYSPLVPELRTGAMKVSWPGVLDTRGTAVRFTPNTVALACRESQHSKPRTELNFVGPGLIRKRSSR